MDRLVCGDVGFGKTEVALRAAFRMAMTGRQVAVLCPTTVLAQQHFLTFKGRLAEFGLEVRPLSRLVKGPDVTRTLTELKRGTVDVIVGTHRLLSKDVHFKNLGMLVIDEEQRFGVTHKERIKQVRKNIDVLTLSATPIPRTLQMAVGGLRDMSVIETPPIDRRPIRTILARTDADLVTEGIRRELARSGQVYYVHNRISGLDERVTKLKAWVPEARIAVAHGQMRPETLEKTMLKFVAGEYDVLVCTAIGESGLDIPRANTMFIDRAELFGLAQLYQLRGRIGRSPERAYCYLLVPSMSELDSQAKARLETIERFTELGMGMRVAALDMELRGAGDLLGAEQSGFVASVGFELFCRLLEDATAEAQGRPVVHEVEPDLNADVEALLPEDYIADVGIRLGFYKQFAAATDAVSIDETATQMEDRFGKPPMVARNLVALMRLKTRLRQLKVMACNARQTTVDLALRSDTPLRLDHIEVVQAQSKGQYRITPDSRLIRKADPSEQFPDGLAHAERALAELEACSASVAN
jgi:transcription-repair coupling factor (superfamily II helicase)